MSCIRVKVTSSPQPTTQFNMTTQHNQMSTENPLKIGDVVRLKSTPVLMTIVDTEGSAHVHTSWHDLNRNHVTARFPVAAITQQSWAAYLILDPGAKSSQTAG